MTQTDPAAATLAAGATLAAARRAIVRRLRAAGLDAPETDARLLMQAALGLDRAALMREAGRALSADETSAVEKLVARRLAHEPVARILGVKEFWSLPLRVSPATLAPRPETETVVEAALGTIPPARRGEPLRIADLGAGTGAILLALLSELPAAFGVGTDISPEALHVAAENAAQLGLAGRAAFVTCNYADALGHGFDLVVSNPPYIPSGDIPGLMPEVRDYDPHRALDGGADGLAAYRALAAGTQRPLRPAGALVVEVGAGQADDVRRIFTETGWDASRPPHDDLAGVPRALVFVRNAA